MDKPLMYIEQPDLEIFYRSMQQTYYVDMNKNKKADQWEIPTLIGNVVCEIKLKDEVIRGEVIEEKEKELVVSDEHYVRRKIQKRDIEHVQVISI